MHSAGLNCHVVLGLSPKHPKLHSQSPAVEEAHEVYYGWREGGEYQAGFPSAAQAGLGLVDTHWPEINSKSIMQRPDVFLATFAHVSWRDFTATWIRTYTVHAIPPRNTACHTVTQIRDCPILQSCNHFLLRWVRVQPGNSDLSCPHQHPSASDKRPTS